MHYATWIITWAVYAHAQRRYLLYLNLGVMGNLVFFFFTFTLPLMHYTTYYSTHPTEAPAPCPLFCSNKLSEGKKGSSHKKKVAGC